MNKPIYTTEQDVRIAFWRANPGLFKGAHVRQNTYNATTRTLWVDFVDMLQKTGQITATMAANVEL